MYDMYLDWAGVAVAAGTLALMTVGALLHEHFTRHRTRR